MTMDAETIFIDTNILAYATDGESPFQAKSLDTLKQLMTDGIDFAISPQIVREYLVVLTRGLPPDDPVRVAALHNVRKFIEAFILLDENSETVAKSQTIMENCAVGGKQIHDANIVAVMLAHGVKRLLTHNLDDFKKYDQWIEIMGLNEVPL
ncbi:MAG: PIN domain-containing protein [Pseudomonadota bacterium]|nr:PIN domain-containing protein [Pseudomonadota bacterium]